MIKFYLSFSRYLTVLLLCGTLAGFAQQKTVSGKVTSSDDGSNLPGVNILEKGTTNGTVTDANGEFKIEVSASATLAFSFVGYTTQEIVVGSQTSITLALVSDAKSLAEVVVIGYGEVQKKDATGAVSAISNKDFNKGVLTSPQDLILGKIAGVSVTSNSGAPGDNSTIRIRGGASLSATNNPLIGIDGFPIDNFAAAVANIGTSSTDWQKEIFRTAISNDHNLNVSGSAKNLPYRVSYGFTDQKGILKTTSLQRNSLNVNLTPTLLNGDLKLNISAK